MSDESGLREKIRKIQALFERAGTSGERKAAEDALNRIIERLKQSRTQDPPVPYTFSLHSPWSRRLFLALSRRYGLEPYRHYRQHFTTVRLKVSKKFVDETLWPEFEQLDKVLTTYLEEVTNKVISETIHGDVSEAKEQSQDLIGSS